MCLLWNTEYIQRSLHHLKYNRDDFARKRMDVLDFLVTNEHFSLFFVILRTSSTLCFPSSSNLSFLFLASSGFSSRVVSFYRRSHWYEMVKCAALLTLIKQEKTLLAIRIVSKVERYSQRYSRSAKRTCCYMFEIIFKLSQLLACTLK